MAPRALGPGNFFEQQDHARQMTLRLVPLFGFVYFFLCFGSYVGLLLMVDSLALLARAEPEWLIMPLFSSEYPLFLYPEVAFIAWLTTTVTIGVGSLIKLRSLRGGGASVAQAMGGVEVNNGAEDPRVRRFVNVVEEMSLASGVPVPRMFVLPRQKGINAFAAGYSTNDAAVAITEGALKELKRDELQAVVAHEFSHILHGDMRLNIKLLGVLHGVMSIFLLGRLLLGGVNDPRSKNSGNSDAGAGLGIYTAIPGLVFCAVGFAGVVGSRLIKAGISRQREYLADASAIQYTRNPEALARALKKIGGFQHGSALSGANAEAVSHMCFGEASSSWLTHPALEERVKAVDPQFNTDAGFLVWEPSDSGALHLPKAAEPRDEGERPSLGAADVLAGLGGASPAELLFCATLLDRMPEEVNEARGSLAGAVALAYLLILSPDKEARKEQASLLAEKADSSVAAEAQRLWPVLRRLDMELRLPLMDLIFPVLRQMTEKQFEEFEVLAQELADADGELCFREFVLEQVVLHRLRVTFGKVSQGVQFTSFGGIKHDLDNLLSAVATVGADGPGEARDAFMVARMALPPVVAEKVEFRSQSQWNFKQVGASMERLSQSSTAIKRAVVEACAHCVLADEKVTVEEAEALRAICDVLDLPLPPFMPVGVVAKASEETREHADAGAA